MRTIDTNLLAANEKRREMQRQNTILSWKLLKKQRMKQAVLGDAQNEYRLFTSGKPTDELRMMTHAEAVAENKARMSLFSEKVRAAIDAGGRYEGTLSHWRVNRHHTEIAKQSEEQANSTPFQGNHISDDDDL